MEAAAHGHSTLGIPRSVGKEFSDADKGKSFDSFHPSMGAGIMYVTPENRALFLRRNNEKGDHIGEWDFPGGGAEPNETPVQTAIREAHEETSASPYGEKALISSNKRADGFEYHTYRQPIMHAFTPKLCEEHDGYVWADVDKPPTPLHPGVEKTLNSLAEEHAEDCWLGQDVEWNEEQHPRAENGEFGSGSGGGGSQEGNSGEGGATSSEPAPTRSRTQADLKAFSEYTGVDFRYANAVARGRRDNLGERQKKIGDKLMADLDKAWETVPPLTEEKTLYRGVAGASYDLDLNPKEAEKFIGKSYTDKGWTSTTSDPAIAKAFAGNKNSKTQKMEYNNGVMFKMKVPKGTRVLDVQKIAGQGAYGNEKEFTLPRGGKIKITGVSKSGGVTTLEAEFIPPPEKGKQAHDSVLFAFDRASVRTVDQDGRLHVELTNISKAAVNPYRGIEIPNGEELGLNPDRIYKLLRDPEELTKAALSFNNLPLLNDHVPVSADDPQQDLVVGSTGTDAIFDAPYLKNSLVIWTKDAIAGIESGEQQEISCAYHYVADMTPGTYEGERYDGVMRNIRGNHVALVATGRAGPDVVVGDSVINLSQEILIMKSKALSKKAVLIQGALMALLGPKLSAAKLATDKMPDYGKILDGVKHKNYLDKKPGIVAALKPTLLLAKDDGGTIKEVVELLDRLDGEGPMDDDDTTMDSPNEGVLGLLRGKVSDEDMAAVDAACTEMMGKKAAMDAEEEEKKKKEAMDAEEEEKKEAERKKLAGDDPGSTEGAPKVMDKKAMDAAIKSAVETERATSKVAMDKAIKDATDKATKDALKLAQDIAAAEETARPYVGKLQLAFDSAEGVYKAALEAIGVKIEGIHPSAYKAVLEAQPKPGSRNVRLASDSGEVAEGFDKRFPDSNRLIQA